MFFFAMSLQLHLMMMLKIWPAVITTLSTVGDNHYCPLITGINRSSGHDDIVINTHYTRFSITKYNIEFLFLYITISDML